jgi:pyrimidine-specific ribonucleoside hydrolase
MVKHIILDTDIGGDPDDIFDLLLELNSPELKLELIVTNDEHKGDRARFAKKFLSLLGKKVPVAAGIDLKNTKYLLIEELIKDYKPKVDFNYLKKIKEVVDKNKITYYACMGPQSNLAKFIETYPELKKKVRLYMMAGGIKYKNNSKAEHNIRYDIEAAKTVFNSDWDKRYVLLDVTFRDEIKVDEKSIFFKKLLELKKPHIKYLINSVYSFFNKRYPETYMHGPLSASYLVDEKVIKFKTVQLVLDNSGLMKIDKKGKQTLVSESANYKMFWKLFENRILK